MARKKSADLEKTKQTILEVGLALFEQKGFNATGIQEIATLANVPKGSFYNYFNSKEDFCVAVIRFYTEASIGRWKNMLAAAETEGSYQALSTVFVEVTERYECAAVKKGCLLGNLAAEISEASEECRMALAESVREFKEILAERLAAGQQAGKVRQDLSAQQLTDLVWDCWQGSLLRMKIEKSAEPVRTNLESLFHRLLLP